MKKKKCIVFVILVAFFSFAFFMICGNEVNTENFNTNESNVGISEKDESSERDEQTVEDKTTYEQETTTEENETSSEAENESKVESEEETTSRKQTEVDKETETTFVNSDKTYTYKECNQKMYATSELNVRKGPGTEYDVIGGLSKNQEVKVTGQCNETGWYRIEYKGTVGYVSNKYLVVNTQQESNKEEITTVKKEEKTTTAKREESTTAKKEEETTTIKKEEETTTAKPKEEKPTSKPKEEKETEKEKPTPKPKA